MSLTFCSLEKISIEKNISDQMNIKSNDKLDVFNIGSDNIDISQIKIETTSKILFSLIDNKYDLVEFCAEMYISAFNNNSTENLKKIWNNFSLKIDYLIFLYNKIFDFNILISKYQTKDIWEFEEFIENLEDDLRSNLYTVFTNIMNIIYFLWDNFTSNSIQINLIFKENILKVEKFIRESFFEDEKSFYRDNEYLEVLKLIKSHKIWNDLYLDNFLLDLLSHPYYHNSELFKYLNDYNFMSYYEDFDKILEKINDKENSIFDIISYFYEYNDDLGNCQIELSKFINQYIHHNIEVLFDFLEKYPDRNSEIFTFFYKWN